MGVLLITHDLTIVEKVSDSVAVMRSGHVVETNETAALFAAPRHPYTQRLFMAAPVPDPDRQETRRVERRRLMDEQRATAALASDAA